MDDASETSQKPPVSIPMRLFNFLSGFGLATFLLLLLGLLTWLATLEQVEHGLLPTLKKYFDSSSFFFTTDLADFHTPELPRLHLEAKPIRVPLPGGYWVCALLFVNLLLGGVIRARKGWKHAGNLISHAGILLLIVAGGVAQWKEVRGNMAVSQGETSNVAEDYNEYVIEVSELKDGKPENIHVIPGKYLDDLQEQRMGSFRWFNRKLHGMATDGSTARTFRLTDFPFDLTVYGWFDNCQPVSMLESAPEKQEPVVDGYFLSDRPPEKQSEMNTPGCYARVVNHDGTPGEGIILAGASFYGKTLQVGDRTFLVDFHKRYWPVPFKLRLDKFTAKFAPNTKKAESFVSNVTRFEDGHEIPVTIQMNEPMRTEGLTFYQASYGPNNEKDPAKMYSVFEVVRNPSDQWPKISIAIVAFGLAVQFILKLVIYINARLKA